MQIKEGKHAYIHTPVGKQEILTFKIHGKPFTCILNLILLKYFKINEVYYKI